MMLLKKFLSLSRYELEEYLQTRNISLEVIDNLEIYKEPAFGILGISGYRSLNCSIVKKNQLPLTISIKHYGVSTCSILINILEDSEEYVEIVYNYETGEVRRILYFDPDLNVTWVESLKDIKWVDIPQTLISDGKERNSNN